MEDLSMILSIVWFASVAIGSHIGNKKGKRMKAVVLTLCLGVFGLIFVLAMKPTDEVEAQMKAESGEIKKCPFCAETILAEAVVCKHCSKSLE